ncbi:MAG: PQQ-dependent sugar dehydrogenase [bacterium]|nr:PQQ-dependent sugar dehydrogenase [bacterium]
MHRRSLTLALLSCFGAHAAAQDLTTERIATGFDEPLFAGAPAGDFGRLFIVEQRGRIEILDITNDTQVGTFLDLSAIVNDSGNERGLLGLAFHPDYMTNGRFFVSYTAEVDGSSHLIEYSAIPPTSNVANPTPVQTIYTLPQPFQNHNGGCIQFAPDGKLYLSIGDGGMGGDPFDRAQDLDESLGKILRFDVDIPAPFIPGDNPFVGAPGNDEIWSYGLRNPWRFSFDRLTGDMYIGDVGQGSWEELDFQPASSTGGENYGWHCYQADSPWDTSNCPPIAELVFPFHAYPHSDGCSVIAGYVYRGSAITGLEGTYFFADHCSDTIWSLRYDGTNVTEFTDRTDELNPSPGTPEEITSFGEDAAGELYIVDRDGEIYRLLDDCQPQASTYCITSPNASGPGARIFASGSLSLGDNLFRLAIDSANPMEAGIFFYGLGAVQQPFGNGVLCVDISSGLYRLPVVQVDAGGRGSMVVDFDAPPMDAGPGLISPSTTYFFQFWYRDVGGPGPSGFNFSDGMMVTFCL